MPSKFISLFKRKDIVPLDNSTNKKNIFAFWESENGMPAYLELCKQTWEKNIIDCSIHIINYENIDQYIGGIYDLEKLKKIPLAMQSDIISAAVLEKFGGVFLDLDCIVTNDIFKIFNLISKDKLISFGVPRARSIHLAVLYSYNPNNPILRDWRIEAQKKLESVPDKYRWDYFGNAIINPLLKDNNYKDYFHIIDRTISGNILESIPSLNINLATTKESYIDFYFNKYFSVRPNILELVKCGIISLHNSWTPPEYKKITEVSEFLKLEVALVDILKFSLKDEKRTIINNSLPSIEYYLKNNLLNMNINYKSRYFKGMLVLEFKVNDINFAFDVHEVNNVIKLALVLRNNSNRDSVKNHILQEFVNKSFKVNKMTYEEIHGKNKLLEVITYTYSIVSSYNKEESVKKLEFNEFLVENSVFTNLKLIDLRDKVLYIEGICIPIEKNIKSYKDIKYSLVFKGETCYKKNLAKLSKPNLTELYSKNNKISYDKCWFTTFGNKGIDISGLEKGVYTLQLEVEAEGVKTVQELKSEIDISKKNKYFIFHSSNIGNQLKVI